MGDWGRKISQPGYDVKTAAVINLVYTSARNTGLCKLTGTATLNSSTSAAVVVTIAHGLGYVPGALMFLDDGTNTYNLPSANYSSLGMTTKVWFTMDSTNLRVVANADTSNKTYTIRYILMVQQLT